MNILRPERVPEGPGEGSGHPAGLGEELQLGGAGSCLFNLLMLYFSSTEMWKKGQKVWEALWRREDVRDLPKHKPRSPTTMAL